MGQTDGRDIEKALKDHAPGLTAGGLALLAEMYAAGSLPAADGRRVRIDARTRIDISQGAQMHRLIRERGAKHCLEIGLAYGYSTIWILDALSQVEGGSHCAIDPFETSRWKGVGLRQIERLDARDVRFEWIEDRSILALPRLIADGRRFDFIFIDGNHRFDDVLVDFHLSDCLLETGGIMAFDDMWMESIRAVASFVETNRSYAPVRQSADNMAVFRKRGEDRRPWHHYRSFRSEFPPAGTPVERMANHVRFSRPARILKGIAGRVRRLRADRD